MGIGGVSLAPFLNIYGRGNTPFFTRKNNPNIVYLIDYAKSTKKCINFACGAIFSNITTPEGKKREQERDIDK